MHSILVRWVRGLGSAFSKLSSFLFGEIHWRPPVWGRFLARFGSAHPRGISLAFLVLLIGGSSLWIYQHQPRPPSVQITVNGPALTPLEKELKPQPVFFNFDQVAAPLGKVGASVNFQLTPRLEGEWKWTTDRQLVFSPHADWPANTEYQVTFTESDLDPRVHLEDRTIKFRTSKLNVHWVDAKLYQDPVKPEERSLVATIESSHPVSTDALKQAISMQILGGSPLFSNSGFDLRADFHNHRFYFRSTNLTLPEHEDFVSLQVDSSLSDLSGNSKLTSAETAKVRVPDKYNLFRIDDSKPTIVKTDSGDSVQLVTITTTVNSRVEDLSKNIEVWLLPPKEPEVKTDTNADQNDNGDTEMSDNGNAKSDNDSDTDEDDSESDQPDNNLVYWNSAAELTPEILQKAQRLTVSFEPESTPFAQQHFFKVQLPKGGQLLIKIHKDTPAPGGCLLANEYRALVNVDPLPREIQIQGDGGLMALRGERTLSLLTRGVQALQYVIAKVLPDQINHLVTQTSGSFDQPEFLHGSFSELNISVVSRPIVPIVDRGDGSANFSSLQLDPYLISDGRLQHGLFIIRTLAVDPKTHRKIRAKTDSRFLLVTDLGLISKSNNDKSRDFFVVSLKKQVPVAGANVSVLARNGQVLVTGQTDSTGHWHCSALDTKEKERQPAVITAQLADDLCFMPFERETNLLDYSRFEVDGPLSPKKDSVEAFPFTDREVYRPGETIHLGVLVRANKNTPIPLTVELDDASGNQVATEDLDVQNLAETKIDTEDTWTTGEYHLTISLRDKAKTVVAENYLHLEEIQPDRLKLTVDFSNPDKFIWLKPEEVKVQAHLENLFGTVAVSNLIKTEQKVTAGNFSLSQWPKFIFFNPSVYPSKNDSDQSDELTLSDVTTDSAGNAIIDSDLGKYANGCYQVKFEVEAFEADQSRSVRRSLDVTVSDRDYIVGFRTSNALKFLKLNDPAAIELAAIDRKGALTQAPRLKLTISKDRLDPVLTKQEDGTLKYEKTVRTEVVRT
ncbi:MAG: hypothetical protein JO308_10250, partial [Verrucomicrobia bacterium]|nr:hypothetical protein [Verrucomicrobiota bacterium]